MSYLENKQIIVGITGSIAAYKSAELVRRLREAGATVRVVMTDNACQFITPLTMQAVSGLPVHTQLFDLQAEAAMGHIELARWADLLLIAPASADFIARLNQGQANDLLTTLCLATQAPIALAPAMNQAMWSHPLTQANCAELTQKGVSMLGPNHGHQACGDTGPGRMLEPSELVTAANQMFANNALAGLNVLVTAGPTHEAIDPVRYIANSSSGKMGYALAEAALAAGAKVHLISGPTALKPPSRADVTPVTTACEMYDEVMKNIANYDIFIAVAAVADYRPRQVANHKIHKTTETMQLELVKNPDIVLEVAKLPNAPFIVGFAAETENVIAKAQSKRQNKQIPLIIANQVGKGLAMGQDDNMVYLISEHDNLQLGPAPKRTLAREIVTLIANRYKRVKQ